MSDLMNHYNHTYNERLILNDNTWRKRLWAFIDDPTSSIPAMVWSIFITIVVLTAIFSDAVSTLPEFNEDFTNPDNKMAIFKLARMMNYDNATYEYMLSLKPGPILPFLDLLCHIILTIEFIIAFIVCPAKKLFAKRVVRLLTLLGYISYWAKFALPSNTLTTDGLIRLYIFISHLTVFRIFRLLSLADHVPAFHVIKLTFASSKQELAVLISIFGLLVIVFSEFMLYFELFYNVKMQNRFAAMYWAVITLTTVGYGDYTPSTIVGHVIACVCATCGLIILALPIGVIASTFCTFFNFRKYAHKQYKSYGSDKLKIQ